MLKNAWYPAAIAAELRGAPIERTVCGVPMVLFRTASGNVAAIHAFCSHRRAPLVLGAVHGESIACAYHGICFDGHGRCTDVPTQRKIPVTLNLPAHPVLERYGFIWVWPGRAQTADPSLMPNLGWREHPDWNADVVSYRRVEASAELARDNLLDLTHIPFIHSGNIGYDPERLRDDPMAFEQDGTTLRTTRVFENIQPSITHAKWHPFRGTVRRTSISEWKPPGFVHILVRNEDSEVSLERHVDHFVVPETVSTHHYFYCMTRNFKIDDRATSDEHVADMDVTLEEDALMVEAQQRGITASPSSRDTYLAADRILIQANRILSRLEAAEAEVDDSARSRRQQVAL